MSKHRAHLTSGGFTLVETIVVMVVMSIAALGIATMSGNLFNAETNNKALEIGDQLMQGCAEQLLATRRENGYAASSLANSTNATTSCNNITSNTNGVTYSAPTVTVMDGNSNVNGMSACPNSTGSNCKLVAVKQGGIKAITFMLIN